MNSEDSIDIKITENSSERLIINQMNPFRQSGIDLDAKKRTFVNLQDTEENVTVKNNPATVTSMRRKNDDMNNLTLVVDQISGPYFTIQSAIDKALPGSVIKIADGLYLENLVITNKTLTLEARDINCEVFILGKKGPTVLIQQGANTELNRQTNTNALESQINFTEPNQLSE